MSFPTRVTSNRLATIWTVESEDEFGLATYGAPYTITCTFERGSTRQYIDANGTIFIPKSVYWYEYEGVEPNLNDFIALGDHTNIPDPNNVNSSELIRNVVREDNSILGDIDDMMVLT